MNPENAMNSTMPAAYHLDSARYWLRMARDHVRVGWDRPARLCLGFARRHIAEWKAKA